MTHENKNLYTKEVLEWREKSKHLFQDRSEVEHLYKENKK